MQNQLSYLFSISEISPSFDKRPPRYASTPTGQIWVPPNRKNDLYPRPTDPIDEPIFKYNHQSGTVTIIDKSTYPRASELNTKSTCPWMYRTYTMFMQQNNGSIVAVNFDARRKDVRESDIADWREIGFHHPTSNTAVYSYLDVPGEYAHLAKGASNANNTWVTQLFPQQYQCFPMADPQYHNLRHAGLIGRLPLIIGLAAYSCGPSQVAHVLTHCFKRGRWVYHAAPHRSSLTTEVEQ